jgi:hypothetical protein
MLRRKFARWTAKSPKMSNPNVVKKSPNGQQNRPKCLTHVLSKLVEGFFLDFQYVA